MALVKAPPDIVILGAMKAATTSLHRWLGAYPEVHRQKVKEPHYFSDDAVFARGWDAYCALFEREEGQRAIDASPLYLDSAFAVTAARRMHDALPDAKLIAILREPVARMASNYLHQVRKGREKRAFVEAIDDLDDEYVRISCYAPALAPYFALFPRTQIHVARFDRLVGSDDGEWRAITRFLGLPDADRPSEKRNETESQGGYTPLLRALVDGGLSRAVKKVPRPLRRLARPLFVRDGWADDPRFAVDVARVPDHVHARFAEDARALADLLGWPKPIFPLPKAKPSTSSAARAVPQASRLDDALVGVGVGRAARSLAGNVAVLAYHDVTDAETFRAQMEWVRAHMQPIDVRSLGGALPRRAVCVTFDDGDPSVHDAALPILRALDIPAALYVVPSRLDTDRPHWWSEVRTLVARGARADAIRGLSPDDAVRALKKLPNDARLAAIDSLRDTNPGAPFTARQLTTREVRALDAAGVHIGNHTMTHPCLDRCSDDVIAREIEGAHDALEATLDRPVRAFAYPNGDYTPVAARVLARLGYESALLFDHRRQRAPIDDALRISRLRVNSTTPLARFELIVSGVHPPLMHARDRVRAWRRRADGQGAQE